MENRLPPQNIEAEESILCRCFLDKTSVLEITDRLFPEDFYKSAHKDIFKSMQDLAAKKEPIDLITVKMSLEGSGLLEHAGGASYLCRLTDIPMATDIDHYCQLIKDAAIRRNLIEQSSLIAQQCFESMESTDRILDDAQKSILDIQYQTNAKTAFTYAEAIAASIDVLEERCNAPKYVTGVPMGYSRLDANTCGLQPSDLILLAARPSMGKTALAMNITHNAAKAGYPVHVFSLEMSTESWTGRALSEQSGVDSHRIRSGHVTQDDWFKITDAAGTIADMPVLIDETPQLNYREVVRRVRRSIADHGTKLVIIDYLQLMRGDKSEKHYLEVGTISAGLKAAAKEFKIPIMALSQLNRNLENRSDKRPTLADLRESGSLEQDADVVMFIYRDEVYNTDENNPNKGIAEINIAKQRNGPIGTSRLTWMGHLQKFGDIAEL